MHPVVCAAGPGRRRRLRGRLERQDRPRALALQVGADRVLAAAAERACSTSAPGTTTSTRSTPRPAGRSGRFQADDEVNTSAAYWQRTIYIASDGGTLYALNARHGEARAGARSRRRASAHASSSTPRPTVAYGRVYIGNTDGTMYVFGAKSGKLLWARPLGTYIYGAAAVWTPARLRGHLRRQALRARRRHGRHEVADRHAERRARGADRDVAGSSTTRPARAAARRPSAP